MRSGEIIDVLGGTVAVAAALGVSRGAVSKMRDTGFPKRHLLSLENMAKSKDLRRIDLRALVNAPGDLQTARPIF